jgi:hypothetical protein
MEDRIPCITNADIKRIIERDFPKNERDRVIKTLNRYKSESEKGANRVHAAILKISDGSVEKVEKNVEVAIIDYRDVLSWAEYPSYSKNLFEEFSYEKEKQQNDDDWQQYNEWLNKPSSHL